jgi:hypothetical protein
MNHSISESTRIHRMEEEIERMKQEINDLREANKQIFTLFDSFINYPVSQSEEDDFEENGRPLTISDLDLNLDLNLDPEVDLQDQASYCEMEQEEDDDLVYSETSDDDYPEPPKLLRESNYSLRVVPRSCLDLDSLIQNMQGLSLSDLAATYESESQIPEFLHNINPLNMVDLMSDSKCNTSGIDSSNNWYSRRNMLCQEEM